MRCASAPASAATARSDLLKGLMRIAIASLLLLAACPNDSPTTPQSGTAAATGAPTEAPLPPKKKHAPLEAYTAYDSARDGKAQIEAAQAEAKGKNKRVLVMFGGNWCKWCRALDDTFANNAAVKARLEQSFVLVHVDSDSNGTLNDAWGNPFANGFPVLVVVDADGKKLHVQETGTLEMAPPDGGQAPVGHDPDKLITFLKQWSPA